jgi:hypothetical protein
MVFNSSQNSFNSHGTQAESFEVLRNSYNVSNSGYDYQPALRPQGKDYMFPTAVHSMISNYDQNELKYLNHDTMRSREELSGNGMENIEGLPKCPDDLNNIQIQIQMMN